MSAELCDPRHIGGLASWFAAKNRANTDWIRRYVIGDDHAGTSVEDFELAPRLAELMAHENVRSLQACYPDSRSGNRPGLCDNESDNDYFLKCSAAARRRIPRDEIDAVGVLSAVRCYEYQSSEHGTWEHSIGKRIADAIQASAIRALPGMKEAKWGWPEPQQRSMKLREQGVV